MTFSEQTLRDAHEHCKDNADELSRSGRCGCFYCGRVFDPEEVVEWTGGRTRHAICPHCHVDAIIGDASGISLTKEFLQAMHDFWFSLPNQKK